MVQRLLASLAVLLALAGAPRARAAEEVDLTLVLAVDVSRSMDADEQKLQRAGYVEAFRSPGVHDAIAKGAVGAIAVSYVEWSGPSEQKVVIPWTVLTGATDALAFADRLSAAPIGLIFSTSISGVIDFSVRHTQQGGFEALRRVIDVSGDGPNNTGRPVTMARDEAVAAGFTVNGLAFMVKRPSGRGDMENLDLYYRDCVIGGPESFVEPIRDRDQVLEATRRKIIREIAGGALGGFVTRAQVLQAGDCLAGEQQRQRSWGP